MWSMILPILIIVCSNCCYHICAKSVPSEANTFGALTVTYLVAAIVSATAFLIGVKPANAGLELAKLNWSSLILGVAVIGLEAGNILLYRAGWKISAGSVTSNICLAIALLFVGALVFRESISLRQVAGIVVCAFGLFLING